MKDRTDYNTDNIFLCEWDAQEFRKSLAYWESKGYQAHFTTYKMETAHDPFTGRAYLRYSIGLKKPKGPEDRRRDPFCSRARVSHG